ncbi:CHAT domain-containing protein [Halioxenophilus sp. WMMB6]|uniref:CHAT domain-containing protein n=1 Tax=Halioxenophilus sp. WMMB6 TaxID=3073815 RepID=UPI00295E20FF|nr:CHAT domain-containing protein [Halioxenophilus sp. WMMB6]
MKIDIEEWLAAAFAADSQQFSELIAELPPSTSQSTAVQLAAGSPLDSRVYALRSVSQDHSVGGEPQLAIGLATLGLALCQQAFARYGPGVADTFPFGVAQFALDAQRAYDRAGRYREQLQVIEQALAWLQANHTEPKLQDDLIFARIEALISLGELEEASRSLAEQQQAGRAHHHLFTILSERLNSRLKSATESKDQRSLEQRLAAERKDSLKSVIGSLQGLAPEFASLLGQLNSEVDSEPDTLSASDAIAKSHSLYQKMGQFMEGMASGAGQQIALNGEIQRVSAVLADPLQGREAKALRTNLVSLENVRAQAIEAGLEETAVDTLWPLYVCYKRLQMLAKAIEALQLIRRWQAARRLQISDPLKRAGITQMYPLLYVELAARLTEQGEHIELLNIIEEAKGRALADSLALEAARDNELLGLENAGQWLPELMVELGAHYLTYLLDEEYCFAVCVTKTGQIHSATLPVGSELIGRYRNVIDPSQWGKKLGFKRQPDDIAKRLSPLVGWLQPLLANGSIALDDHFCYSPDGLLHLLPLHYLQFEGEPFVNRFSLSRVHCAALMQRFAAQPPRRPDHYLTVQVPLASEAANNPGKVAQLGAVAEWLADSGLPGKPLRGTAADIATLQQQPLASALLHFATHGYFPKAGSGQSAFAHSGLLLANAGQLPEGVGDEFGGGGLLSPAQILNGRPALDLRLAHISLQACVSGLAEEGVGGDALGLEWSLLMAKAASVLSSHWNVAVGSSAEFCIVFYEQWLLAGKSRAEAWRSAVRQMMPATGADSGASAYHWAAYSLAGDWR